MLLQLALLTLLSIAAPPGFDGKPNVNAAVTPTGCCSPVQARALVGQAAVDRLMNQHRQLLADGLAGKLAGANVERFDAARAQIDAAAGARDAWLSGLAWHSDLNAAKSEARKTGKPILSLRMLGKLTDELSCANSRFFRTLLYPDPAVAAALRKNFVLHWSSERPVPQVTVDMGDGRTLKTTIAGNSIHYVLDADGRVFEAIPGLVAPSLFLAHLDTFTALHRRLAKLGPKARQAALVSHHTSSQKPRKPVVQKPARKPVLRKPPVAVAAVKAIPVAAVKGFAEMPLIASARQRKQAAQIAQAKQAATRGRFGNLKISAQAKAAVAWKSGWQSPHDAARLATRVNALMLSLRADTAENLAELRPKIQRWIAAGLTDFSALNARVYSRLFLTPATDPWLGLVNDAVYSGAPRDGQVAGRRIAGSSTK